MSPLGPYKNFSQCVKKNEDKRSPEGYCATIEKNITGKWPRESDEEKESSIMDIKKIAESIVKESAMGMGDERFHKILQDMGVPESRWGSIKKTADEVQTMLLSMDENHRAKFKDMTLKDFGNKFKGDGEPIIS